MCLQALGLMQRFSPDVRASAPHSRAAAKPAGVNHASVAHVSTSAVFDASQWMREPQVCTSRQVSELVRGHIEAR